MCKQIFDNLQLKAIIEHTTCRNPKFYRITTGAHVGNHTHHRPGTHVLGGEVFFP